MKKILYVLALVTLTVSCQTAEKPAETKSGSVETVQRLFEHFNKHEWDKMAALYADTADFMDPALGRGLVKQTRQQVSDKYKQLNGFLPDISIRQLVIYPSGDGHVIAEFVSTGTAPDGTRTELPICTVFTVDKGLITSDHTYYDNAAPASK